jgi:hypothetical protein
MAKQGEATLLLRIKEMGAEAIDKVQESIGALKAFALVAFTAISAVVYKSIDAYREQEEATNQLSQAMANAGVFSEALRKKYLDQASALQKITTFADEQIVSAQAVLQAFTGGREVTEDLTRATLNLAAAKKMDLASAAELVGKSIGGTINMLSRQGIQFDNNTVGAQRLAAVTEALNQKFGGQAEAAARGLGSLKQLQNATGDVFEVMGERLAPAVTIVAREMTIMAEQFQKNEMFLSGFVSIAQFGLKIVNGLGSAFHDLSSAIGGYLGMVSGAMAQVMSGQFKQAKETIRSGLADIQKMGEENEAAMLARQAAIDSIDTAHKQEKQAKDLALLQESLAKQTSVKTAASEMEFVSLQEQRLAQMESENALIGANQEQQLSARIAHLNKMISAEEDYHKKAQLMRQKEVLLKQQKEMLAQKAEIDLENATMQAKVNIASSAANLIAAATDQGSKLAFYAMKAAALAQAFVSTKLAATQALAVPPAPNFALAGMAETAGYTNMAAIGMSAIKGLATGGVVPATQGGKPFILGEGGKDEAVIPLENGMVPGMGGPQIHFHVGAMMGTEQEAREFARMIDQRLYQLRLSNESVSFDGIS